MSLDGKKLGRSHNKRHERDGIWMVSAWAGKNRMVLGQTKVDEKSNEITAIPHLLTALDISGCVVKVDALGTQTAIAQQIIEAGVDENLKLLFEGFETDAYAEAVYDDQTDH